MGNEHGRPRDVAGEVRQAFTSTADTAFDVCLENQLSGRRKFPNTIQIPTGRRRRILRFLWNLANQN